MKKVVLISCVSEKGARKAKAKDLYISPLFKYSLAYAYKQNPAKIFILSAKHHLLNLEEKIKPYNVTLSYIPPYKRKPNLKILTKEEKILWGNKVVQRLSKNTNLKNDLFIILAGQSYINPIRSYINNIEEPLKGLRQGERLKYLLNYS